MSSLVAAELSLKMTMRLEVIGHPGSGKTYLCARMNDAAAGSKGIKCIDPRETWKRDGLYGRLHLSFRWPLFTILLYLTSLTSHGCRLSHLKLIYSVQKRLNGLCSEDSSSNWSVRLFDRGPVHGLYEALLGVRTSRVSRLLLKVVVGIIVDHVDGFIHLEATREQCVSALEARVSARQLSALDTSFDWYSEVVKCVKSECAAKDKLFLELPRNSRAVEKVTTWLQSEL